MQVLYVEALRRGFQDAGRPCRVANMTTLAANPAAMPRDGKPLVVLGYMKQFRQHFSVDAGGRLLLFGRQVRAHSDESLRLH